MNAASIWLSMAFSARDSRPSSEVGFGGPSSGSGTRRVRSPPAIAAAVRSISTSGLRLVRTMPAPIEASRISTALPTRRSIQTSRGDRQVDVGEGLTDGGVPAVGQFGVEHPPPAAAVLGAAR